jgi:putative ABC transport system permease protein
MQLTAQERQRWLSERTAAIAGKNLAVRYGWKVGDTISLPSTIYVKKDGTRNWDVTIVAIIPATTTGLGRDLYFHHEYFNESVAFGANTLAYIMSRVSGAEAAERVRAAIDGHFASSAARTRTVPVSVYIRRGITQLGNVSAVVIAIIVIAFFTMMLITASTMGQSVRERAAELAVLKTLGFTDVALTSLVLGEATLMGVAGAAIAGALLAAIASAAAQDGTSTFIIATGHLLQSGVVLVVACSAAACALPLIQVWRESIAEGLRHE